MEAIVASDSRVRTLTGEDLQDVVGSDVIERGKPYYDFFKYEQNTFVT